MKSHAERCSSRCEVGIASQRDEAGMIENGKSCVGLQPTQNLSADHVTDANFIAFSKVILHPDKGAQLHVRALMYEILRTSAHCSRVCVPCVVCGVPPATQHTLIHMIHIIHDRRSGPATNAPSSGIKAAWRGRRQPRRRRGAASPAARLLVRPDPRDGATVNPPSRAVRRLARLTRNVVDHACAKHAGTS